MKRTPSASDRLSSYTEEKVARLTRSFNLVANAENWKFPIDAVVFKDADFQEIQEAVVFFTGSVPEFRSLSEGRVHVRAAGYYAAIGA